MIPRLYDAASDMARTPSPADLTPRERIVAQLLADRYTSKRIAVHLGVSVGHIDRQIRAIAIKTDAPPEGDDRVHIALWWHQHHPPLEQSA